MQKYLFCMLVAAWLIPAGAGLAEESDTPDTPDALASANATIRELFATNFEKHLTRSGPLIVVHFDRLILYRGGREVRSARFTPPHYHHLKSISHMPLGIGVIAINALADPADASWRSDMKRLRDAMARIDRKVLRNRFEGNMRDLERTILAECRDFADRALKADRLTEEMLAGFSSRMTPLFMRNVEAAAQAQIDGLHRLVTEWKEDLGPESWNDLHVLVLGSRAPRTGNLQFEYFVRVLGEEAIGHRLLYLEGVFEPDAALESFGRLLQDRAAAESFFGREYRLDRDLLADAAADHLDTIFGRSLRSPRLPWASLDQQ